MITRRTLLRGLLGGALVSIGLPPLERFLNAHGTAYADATSDGFPKRFGTFFWGNGVVTEKWIPTGEGLGDAWQLSEELMPLAALKDLITVVTGMQVKTPNNEPHLSTAAGMLSGHRDIDDGGHTYGAPTIDQVVAEVIGAETRFRSLEFGVAANGMSYTGPHAVNPPERSPAALFERVFGGSFQLPGEDGKVDPTLALQRSILDAVTGQIATLKTRVGASDRTRLEQHFDGIRAIELQLAKLEEDPPNLAACAYPPTPDADYPDIEGRPQLVAKNKAFAEIIAMALACDQTRVFFNEFTHPVTNILFRGVAAGHHSLTHDEPGDQPQVHAITVQCMEAYAQQLEALRAVEEGDGTLLDHCLILATSDVSKGRTHSPDDFPIVLGGSGGGAIQTGMHYRSPSNESTSKVLLTITRAMGLQLPSIGGDEGYTEDAVDGIMT